MFHACYPSVFAIRRASAIYSERPTVPKYGLIMPVHNASKHLPTVLAELRLGSDWEVVLIDDGSSDDSAQVATRILPEAKILQNPIPVGPARARNQGVASCTADIVVFVDSDVEAASPVLQSIVRFLDDNPDFTAVFGAYDDEPAVATRISRFRNLLHHYVHCASEGRVPSFWSGFGAIRRDAFEAIGGFDADRYRMPSVEDIDLGARLTAEGYQIYLEPQFQVKHLKHWTLKDFIRTDVFNRARPWARMIFEGRAPKTPLNLGGRFRHPILLLMLGLVATLGWQGSLVPEWVPAVVWTLYLSWNLPIYHYMNSRGVGPVSVLLLALHHLCALVGGAIGALDVLKERLRS
jgi:GT2 family glycosyltransferase